MAAGHFDPVSRDALPFDPQRLLDFAFPEVGGTLRYEPWLNPPVVPLPGVADRTGDIIVQVASTLKPDWHGALPIEDPPRPEPDLAGRELCYCLPCCGCEERTARPSNLAPE
ncbi:MAG: hypothetical protein FJX77_04175 [Armatimonadetes bacterium]|nr:hypothetical protein [Armatimonadota bacterium]